MLGNNVGIQATLLKAEISGELIRASSETPPLFESGPTASTRQRISSLQKPVGDIASLCAMRSDMAPEFSKDWLAGISGIL